MKLLRYTTEQLKLIIKGIILGFEYINTLDTNYNITIFIVEFKDKFSFEILWNYGTHIDDDERVLIGRDKFFFDKDTELYELASRINNTLDEITSKTFDSELSDDEFNTSNND